MMERLERLGPWEVNEVGPDRRQKWSFKQNYWGHHISMKGRTGIIDLVGTQYGLLSIDCEILNRYNLRSRSSDHRTSKVHCVAVKPRPDEILAQGATQR